MLVSAFSAFSSALLMRCGAIQAAASAFAVSLICEVVMAEMGSVHSYMNLAYAAAAVGAAMLVRLLVALFVWQGAVRSNFVRWLVGDNNRTSIIDTAITFFDVCVVACQVCMRIAGAIIADDGGSATGIALVCQSALITLVAASRVIMFVNEPIHPLMREAADVELSDVVPVSGDANGPQPPSHIVPARPLTIEWTMRWSLAAIACSVIYCVLAVKDNTKVAYAACAIALVLFVVVMLPISTLAADLRHKKRSKQN